MCGFDALMKWWIERKAKQAAKQAEEAAADAVDDILGQRDKFLSMVLKFRFS